MVRCPVITVAKSSYLNTLLKCEAISYERRKNSYVFPKYPGYMQDCGFHLWGACYGTTNIEWNHIYHPQLQGLSQF